MNEKKYRDYRKTVWKCDSIINWLVLVIMIPIVLFAIYANWDSNQIYSQADSSQFEQYKPAAGANMGFDELCNANPDVFAWINIYGTHIDYPVLQGDTNDSYINTDIFGNHSLSGCIFMDYRNKKNFKDFNSIIYGHHMERKAMFGELDTFQDKAVFDQKRYGNIFFDGKDHGLEIFAYLEADAYDMEVYRPGVEGEKNAEEYLKYISKKAVYSRDIDVKPTDKIVLLSTCASYDTNGRNLLVCRITDEVFENTLSLSEGETMFHIGRDKLNRLFGNIPGWFWPILLIILLALLIIRKYYISKSKGGK